MSATSPNVGVRVFSDLRATTATIDTRDSTIVGMAMPLPNMAAGDASRFPLDEPITLSMRDSELISKMGPGFAYDAIRAFASEGISTDIPFVRVATNADPEEQIGLVAGDAAAKTGLWALTEAKSHTGLEPGLIITPGMTALRPGNARNPAAMAMDGVCAQIIDCFSVTDTPETSREAAAEWAEDFATSLNMIAMYPGGRYPYGVNGAYVTRPLSPSVAAAIVRRDKEVGNPYKAAWNRPLRGLGGPSQTVTYQDGATDTDANFLLFRGVGTVIEGSLLWAPFTTATDPTTIGYRSIKRIRTRRAIEKSFLRTLRTFVSEDMGPHLVTRLFITLDEALQAPIGVGALIPGSEVIFDRGLNTNGALRAGALKLKLRFEETPDLTDLGIYTEPQPEAFDVLAGNIRTAIESLGNPNFRFVDAI